MNEPSNPFAVAASQAGTVQVAQSKEAQQIQAQLVIAKRFPRDQHAAYQEIMKACQRIGLAEEASYLYSRGGTQITGPSIRLLEVIAGCWGNFRSGVIELDQDDGESRMEAFAWDLQSNTYDSKTFTIRHERFLKSGQVQKLDDPRDKYEHVANFAARRKRASMEAIIPRDIIEDALAQCDKTLKSGHTEPLADRIRKMATAFADFGVSTAMLEKRLQHKLDATIEQELVLLRKIFTSLKDGMAKREDFFDLGGEPVRPQFDDTAAESAAGLAPSTPQQPPTSAEPKGKRARAAAGQTTGGAAAPPAAAVTHVPPAAVNAPGQVAPPSTPAPAAAAQPAPTQSAAAPAPVDTGSGIQGLGSWQEPQSPDPSSETPPELFATPAYNQLAALLAEKGLEHGEVIELCRKRKIMTPEQQELMQLSDEKINDMINHIEVVASAIRIERRAKQQKK